MKNSMGVKKLIDIIEAKKAFKEYVKSYNPDDGKVALKISHIMRVSEEARKIARKFKFI